MTLALRELVRRPARFVAATVILTLIALLLLFLGGLLDGLLKSQTGALRAQQADAIIYSEDAQASFQRSRIEPDLRADIERVDGISEVGGLGVVLLGARQPGNDPRDLADVALFGYERASNDLPAPPQPGTAYADETLQADGVEIGTLLQLGPARSPIEVVGFVADTDFNGQSGLWTDASTWRAVLADNRPAAQVPSGAFQALIVSGDSDALRSVDDVTGGRTATLTIDEAIEAIPGVTEQRTTFNQIIGLTLVIALAVVALFFALITVERTALYGVLKAIGARTRTIFAGLIAQALVVTAVAAAIAVAAVLALDQLIPPGSVPLAITTSRIVTSVGLLIVAAVVGCLFSLRRVLRIDPATAIGTA